MSLLRAHTHTHAHTHAHTRTHAHTLALTYTHARTHTLSLSLTPTLCFLACAGTLCLMPGKSLGSSCRCSLHGCATDTPLWVRCLKRCWPLRARCTKKARPAADADTNTGAKEKAKEKAKAARMARRLTAETYTNSCSNSCSVNGRQHHACFIDLFPNNTRFLNPHAFQVEEGMYIKTRLNK